MREKVLVLASVASMIDQFNIPNIKLLMEMGFDVDVACNFIEGSTCSDERILQLKTKLNDMEVQIQQIDFARNVFNFRKNLKAYSQVLTLMKNNSYKFVHCHSPIGGFCGRLAGHKTHTKVIYTAHGFHFYNGAPLINWLVYYPIERYLSRYTDVLITINKEDYARAKTFHAKKVEYVLGVGIDVNKIKAVTVDRAKKRKELGIPENCKVLLSVGELIKRKNHEIVIRALARIEDTSIVYVICGQGPLETYLKELAEKLYVGDRVFLLGFRSDIIEICKSSDVFVFPSLQEGLPVALMEAIAAGLPIVCSRIRGNVDLAKNGNVGVLFDPNSVPQVYSAVLKIEKAGFFEQGKCNLKEMLDFELSKVLMDYKTIYDSIVTEQRG